MWEKLSHNLAPLTYLLELSLKKLKESRLKLNIEKYFFRQTEMECLGFWVTSNGVKPINKKNI